MVDVRNVGVCVYLSASCFVLLSMEPERAFPSTLSSIATMGSLLPVGNGRDKYMESSPEDPALVLRGGTIRALHLQPQYGAFDDDDGCSLRFLLLLAVMPSASSGLQQLSKGASGRPKQSPYTPLMGVVTHDASSSPSSDDEECGKRSWVDHFGGGMVKAKVKVESESDRSCM